ncbi:GNAT family N-acetyltransferase [Streptomyces sp. NPDC058231]|uniref:GNAT family N-acetyltransferase n=1 Tax=Streptomyces sp. NPDC058231 TaxID=3346392 RepID=UPI0036F0B9AF
MNDLSVPRLPAGYRSRPASVADAGEIHRLVAACERELLGSAETGLDAVTADLVRPGPGAAVDTLLVYGPAGELAGRVWLNGGRKCAIDVHPGHQGRGLGGRLLDWAEDRARRAGSGRLAQTVSGSDRAAVALLRTRGYGPFVTQWQMEIVMPAEPGVAETPEGITVRTFRHGDERAAHRLTEDAFDEWQQRRKSYDEWARLTVERPTFATAASHMAFAGDEMIGAVLALDTQSSAEGYIDRVAVRADHRHRGIAGALLRETFRTFYLRGQSTCTLWTHSGTSALPLYERVGMTVRRTSAVYGKALTTG